MSSRTEGTGTGEWKCETKQNAIRVTKSGDAFVSRSGGGGNHGNNGVDSTTSKNTFLTSDREKKRLMRADDPFLVQVEVSTKDGKIKAAKRDKYKQVEEFLHHLEASLSASRKKNKSEKKPLKIDLGSGERVFDVCDVFVF